MRHLLATFLLACLTLSAAASEPTLARFGDGGGARVDGMTLQLLEPDVPEQQNVVAYPVEHTGARPRVELRATLHVGAGGEGGGIAFLHTGHYGRRGAGPFLPEWVAPSLEGSFAVGIDVCNPPTEEMFGPLGNYRGEPEREVSLHWDGREIVKRLARSEFRDGKRSLVITLEHTIGGAEATVQIGDETIYDRFFLPHVQPYEMRLAVGAMSSERSSRFDLSEHTLEADAPTAPPRAPLHVEVFNHVLTDNSRTRFEAEISLPPATWAYGRVILDLDIHDAGPAWDEWDRNGTVVFVDEAGVDHVIVPFITSYRTECSWSVDVTHFRPFLTGKTKLAVIAGTTFYKNRGYMMSVSLDFYPGVTELVPSRVTRLWHGSARYQSDENHFQDFFEPQAVQIDESTRRARLWIAVTGHSQVGEFTPSRRSLAVRTGESDAPLVFDNVLWRDDCYLNPNRPQFGTWKFSRAGWAPGDVVHPWWVDFSEALQPGAEARFDYRPEPYEFPEERRPSDGELGKAQHVVHSYLIEYASADDLMSPPSLQITGVQGRAQEAGLAAGDFLVSYDGKPLESVSELRAAIGVAMETPEEPVQVQVYRGETMLQVEMPPGRMGVNLRGP